MGNNIEYDTTGKPHPYHIVRPSIWPLVSAFAGLLFALGIVFYAHDVKIGSFEFGLKGIFLGVFSVMAVMFFWWKDIVHEAFTEKVHTPIVKIGMRYGMALFIASEVMFFVAFFWAYFDVSLFADQANMPARIEYTGGHLSLIHI